LNTTGQVMESYFLNEKGNTDISLDLSYLPKGIYFLKFQGEDLNNTVKIQLK
jgi:hypothetical protein